MNKIIVMLLAIFGLIPLNSQVLTWTNPLTIPLLTSTSNPSAPEVVVDHLGNAVAIWVETNALGNSNIVASTLPYNSNVWSAATKLSTAAKSVSPHVKVDSNGNAFAIWLESTNGITGTVTSKARLLSIWGAAKTLSATSTASAPQISAGGNKNALAVWLEASQVMSKTCLAGNWAVTTEVLSPAGALFPQVSVNENGNNAVASWHIPSVSLPITNNVLVATKTLTSSFGTARIFSSGIDQSVFARLNIDNNGNFVAVWYQYNLAACGEPFMVALQARAYEQGVDKSIKTITNNFGLINPKVLAADVELDNSGNSVALWNNSPYGSSFYIASSVNQFANLTNDLPWSPITNLSINDNYALDCDVTAAGNNAISISMHQDSVTGNCQILSSLRGLNSSSASSTNAVVVSSTGNNAFPRIDSLQTSSVPPTIYAIAVWLNNTNPASNNVLKWSNGNWSSTALLPPTGLTVTVANNNLGPFIEKTKTLNWTANSAPGVIGYRIYRRKGGDYYLIGSVSSSITQFIDYNRKSGSDTYGIATVDSFGNESSQAVVIG